MLKNLISQDDSGASSKGYWLPQVQLVSWIECSMTWMKGRPGAVVRAVSLSHQVVGSKQPPRRFCGGKACLGFSLPQTPRWVCPLFYMHDLDTVSSKIFCETKTMLLGPIAAPELNEHCVNLFSHLVVECSLCLFTVSASRSFSLLSPFRSKHKVIVLWAWISGNWEERNGAAQHSTYFWWCVWKSFWFS